MQTSIQTATPCCSVPTSLVNTTKQGKALTFNNNNNQPKKHQNNNK
jgi:hypothetical protein